jgi:hypothetical protein
MSSTHHIPWVSWLRKRYSHPNYEVPCGVYIGVSPPRSVVREPTQLRSSRFKPRPRLSLGTLRPSTPPNYCDTCIRAVYLYRSSKDSLPSGSCRLASFESPHSAIVNLRHHRFATWPFTVSSLGLALFLCFILMPPFYSSLATSSSLPPLCPVQPTALFLQLPTPS